MLLFPVPAIPPTVAAGALFGPAEGVLVMLVGAMVSAVGAFALSSSLGQGAARRLVDGRVDRVNAVLVLRLVPLVPFGPLSYACGGSAVPTRSCVLATALGIVPGAAAHVAVETHGLAPSSGTFLCALLGLVALTALGSLLVRGLQLRSLAGHPRTTPTGSG